MGVFLLIAVAFFSGLQIYKYLQKCKTYDSEDFDDMINKVMGHKPYSVTGKQKRYEGELAGITFHSYNNTPEGCTIGWCMHEKNNIHDPNAQKLVSWSGRKLGYVSRQTQVEYSSFADGQKTCAFICWFRNFPKGNTTGVAGTPIFVRGDEEYVRNFLYQQLSKAEKEGILIFS